MISIDKLPEVRGVLKENTPLAPYTWLRVGGPADILFMPKDEADLALFLSSIPESIPVHVLGAASNTLIRDGGIEGITIRLGPAFGKIEHLGGNRIKAGAAVLDKKLSQACAKYGIAGLEFYTGIPGMIGGALRMNAGCYGRETCDVVKTIWALDRRGRLNELSVDDMGYSYRHCSASKDFIFVAAEFEGSTDTSEAIQARMDEISSKREQSQPIREKTGGSTFRNPDPAQSGGRGAWQVIDAAGGRGFIVGDAQMSEKHCNFMINLGEATAFDLEELGETIRSMVKQREGVDLEWEVKRIGRKR